jgi:hypothetical protein
VIHPALVVLVQVVPMVLLLHVQLLAEHTKAILFHVLPTLAVERQLVLAVLQRIAQLKLNRLAEQQAVLI